MRTGDISVLSNPTAPLRIAVVGAGRMGADHIDRLHTVIRRAQIAAVVDVDEARAQSAVEHLDGAVACTTMEAALELDVDAVILATPGFLHEDALLPLIKRGIPVLCEKPLTPDPESALRVVQAEAAGGRRLIQVGFMRRYDVGYRALRDLIVNGQQGQLLLLHHQHRNADVPPGFTNEMMIHDSVVHEFDAVRFLTGEEIVSVQVRAGRRSSLSADGLNDPQIVVIETASGILATVEIFVCAQVGYQVNTQASFERGVASISGASPLELTTDQRTGTAIDAGFETRFQDAYDREVQEWVDSVLAGEPTGPTAWDGYATAACCAAGLASQENGQIVPVELAERPELYR